MNEFKTPKGSVLPLLDLKGRSYLQVMHRLVWFREECPHWGITTDISDDKSFVKATIVTENGRIVAQAHKALTGNRFPLEMAETGAIGRALAMAGFGTQFCDDELDEKDQIADSPVEHVKKPIEPKKESKGWL